MTRTAVFYEAWSGSTAYLVGDVVTSGGVAYLCISAHTNHVPPNGTYWLPLSGTGSGVTYGTPNLTLGTANAAGSTDESIRRDATILAFDATAPSTQAFGDSAAAGSAGVAARRDHKHAMPANPLQTGSSFPGSPASGDRYWRTDIYGGMEFFYDGTRWLSATVFSYTGSAAEEITPVATSGRAVYRWPTFGATRDQYLLELRLFVLVNTTNTGSAYWTFTLDKADTSGSITTVDASLNTSADSANTHLRKAVTVNALLGTTMAYIRIKADKTGAPGTLFLEAVLLYRMVAT